MILVHQTDQMRCIVYIIKKYVSYLSITVWNKFSQGESTLRSFRSLVFWSCFPDFVFISCFIYALFQIVGAPISASYTGSKHAIQVGIKAQCTFLCSYSFLLHVIYIFFKHEISQCTFPFSVESFTYIISYVQYKHQVWMERKFLSFCI